MKLLALLLLLGSVSIAYPAASDAQVRVGVAVGFGTPYYRAPFGYARFHRVLPCYYGPFYRCYPERVVILERPYRRAPVAVVRPYYRRAYRRW